MHNSHIVSNISHLIIIKCVLKGRLHLNTLYGELPLMLTMSISKTALQISLKLSECFLRLRIAPSNREIVTGKAFYSTSAPGGFITHLIFKDKFPKQGCISL